MEALIVSGVTSTISALTILVSGVWRSGLTSTAVGAEALYTTLPVAGGGGGGLFAPPLLLPTPLRWGYLRPAVPGKPLPRPLPAPALPRPLLPPHCLRPH